MFDRVNAGLKTLWREEEKEYLQIPFDFHIADGYYETNNWVEGKDKYFRGYCIDLLSNLHKDYNKEVRKKLKKII